MSTSVRPMSSTSAVTETGEKQRQIYEYLRSKNVPPTEVWLQFLMSSIRPNTPLASLQKTALFRLLSTDFTSSIDSTQVSCLPSDLSDPATKERRLAGPTIVQVLGVEDLGRSLWSQIEAIEAQERGETTRGREVIRVVPSEDNDRDATSLASAGSGPHKLLLQDPRGSQIYGIVVQNVSGIALSMPIGSKMVLRDLVVARGVVLLQPEGVEILGGKVEAWDKAWRDGRKEALKRRLPQIDNNQG